MILKVSLGSEQTAAAVALDRNTKDPDAQITLFDHPEQKAFVGFLQPLQ